MSGIAILYMAMNNRINLVDINLAFNNLLRWKKKTIRFWYIIIFGFYKVSHVKVLCK